MKCYVHPDVDATGTCASCGRPVCSACAVDFNSKVTCKSCVEKMAGQPASPITAAPAPAAGKKEPIISVILSFVFPGIGQIYNGQPKKGVALIVGYILLWAVLLALTLVFGLMTIGFGLFCCMPFFLVPLVLWAYGMYDAYMTADKINRGEPAKDWFA